MCLTDVAVEIHTSNTMAAISHLIAARSEYAMAQLAKRDNWAQREPGVIVVLCIVFLVACLLIGVFISKRVRHPINPLS